MVCKERGEGEEQTGMLVIRASPEIPIATSKIGINFYTNP